MRRLLMHSFMIGAAIGLGPFSDSAAGAQLSALDLQRADAEAAFGLRLHALSALRARAADDQKKYERGCRGKVTTGRTTGPVGIPLEGTWWIPQSVELDHESTPTCRMLVTEIKSHSHQIRRGLERIDEDARRRGVYPGVMRDLKRKYGFE